VTTGLLAPAGCWISPTEPAVDSGGDHRRRRQLLDRISGSNELNRPNSRFLSASIWETILREARRQTIALRPDRAHVRSVVAGLARMPYRLATFNIAGGVFWIVNNASRLLLSQLIPNIEVHSLNLW
jgi:hypothetical protein